MNEPATVAAAAERGKLISLIVKFLLLRLVCSHSGKQASRRIFYAACDRPAQNNELASTANGIKAAQVSMSQANSFKMLNDLQNCFTVRA
jgi:hypothetical protein